MIDQPLPAPVLPEYTARKSVHAARITGIEESDPEYSTITLLFGEIDAKLVVDIEWVFCRFGVPDDLDELARKISEGYYVQYDEGYAGWMPIHTFLTWHAPKEPAK
jgi:hypothetical protein